MSVLEEDALKPFEGHVVPMATAAVRVKDRPHRRATPLFLSPSQCPMPDTNADWNEDVTVDLETTMRL